MPVNRWHISRDMSQNFPLSQGERSRVTVVETQTQAQGHEMEVSSAVAWLPAWILKSSGYRDLCDGWLPFPQSVAFCI